MKKFAILLGSDYLKLSEVLLESNKIGTARQLIKQRISNLFDSNPHNYHL